MHFSNLLVLTDDLAKRFFNTENWDKQNDNSYILNFLLPYILEGNSYLPQILKLMPTFKILSPYDQKNIYSQLVMLVTSQKLPGKIIRLSNKNSDEGNLRIQLSSEEYKIIPYMQLFYRDLYFSIQGQYTRNLTELIFNPQDFYKPYYLSSSYTIYCNNIISRCTRDLITDQQKSSDSRMI